MRKNWSFCFFKVASSVFGVLNFFSAQFACSTRTVMYYLLPLKDVRKFNIANPTIITKIATLSSTWRSTKLTKFSTPEKVEPGPS